MTNAKRFEELLRRANLRVCTVMYFLETYENVCEISKNYQIGNDEEYFIECGRLWGMLEMIQALDLLEKDDRVELLDLILDA